MSDCGVCLSEYDFDDLDIDTYYEREVAIKRNCRCCECGKIIPAGTLHQQCGGVYKDRAKNWRFCLICAEISEAFSCGGGRTFGILWESMNDFAFEALTTGCLDRLKTAAAKAELLRRWNEWKFRRHSDSPV